MPRSRGVKRRLDFLKARQKRRRLVEAGQSSCADEPLGKFFKCPGLNSGHKSYKSYCLKHSDLRKISQLLDDINSLLNDEVFE